MLAISVTEKVFAISLPHLGRPKKCNFTSQTSIYDLSVYKRYYGIVVGSDYNNEPKVPFNKSMENLLYNFNQCGTPAVDVSKAIMKGHDAQEKAWPWQVLMFLHGPDNETKICGGSLISESWVLTAAHCVIDVTLVLFLGVTHASALEDMHREDSGLQFRSPEKIIVHKDYISYNKYDIALVKLDKHVIFDDYVQPICLPKPEQTFENGEDQNCYATGWGASNMAHDAGKTILQQAKVNIMPQSMCIFSYMLLGVRFDGSILCLDLNDDESGTCFGDSGGPLACKIDGRFVLAGVTHVVPSHSNCSHIYFPPADVRVTEHLEWIAINIQKG